jgi:hypothetical protein
MNTKNIEELCANIASSSEKLMKHAREVISIIQSMDDYQYDDRDDDNDDSIFVKESCQECPGCMDCLGLSYRDFL